MLWNVLLSVEGVEVLVLRSDRVSPGDIPSCLWKFYLEPVGCHYQAVDDVKSPLGAPVWRLVLPLLRICGSRAFSLALCTGTPRHEERAADEKEAREALLVII